MQQITDKAGPTRGLAEEIRLQILRPFTAVETQQILISVFALTALTVFVSFQYQWLKQPEQGDPSIYNYIGQLIAHGGLPYRDVIDPKAPGSMYLTALSLVAGRLVHIPDVFSIRILYIALYALLSVVTYLTARIFLKDNLAAILAAAVPLLPGRFPLMMVAGSQPKLPMMVFGLCVLLALHAKKPFVAGVFSMLSCLCWQPGLLFAGVAVLFFSKYLTSWRDGQALKVIAGAAVPLAVVLLYFYIRGGLSDFVRWTFTYDYSVFMPADEKPLINSLGHFWKVNHRIFGRQITPFYVALAGMLWYIILRIRALIIAKGRSTTDELFADAVAISPLVYFAFCMVNMQSGPDLIPFLPFYGIFGAYAISEIGRGLGAIRKRGEPSSSRVRMAVTLTVLAVVVYTTVKLGHKYKLEGKTLSDQLRETEIARSYLKPGDKIYAHGSAELLFFLNELNLNPYISFDTRADDYIAAGVPGGFPAVIAHMEEQAPKLVVMTRLANVKHRKELLDWVDQHYNSLNTPSLGLVYIRKPEGVSSPEAGAAASALSPTRR